MLNSKVFLTVVVVFFVGFFFGCEENESEPTGELRLVFSSDGISVGRVLNFTPDRVVITIENSLGEEVLSEAEIDIIVSGEQFILDPIILPVGDYKITEFFVLNGSSEMIYAVPTGPSILSDLVSFSLPIDFSIGANEVSNFEVEVIDTSDVSIEELGYSSVSFTIVPTIDVLVSLFRITSENTGFELIEGSVEYYGDGELITTYDLKDEITQIRVRVDYDEIELRFNADGFDEVIKTFSSNELDEFKTQPLEIFFDVQDNGNSNVDLSDGLFAYYPFSGNADNSVSNNHNGQVVGPLLTEDRFGNPNSAYSFDGLDDYIDVGNSEEFILGNNESYSISVWAKPQEKEIVELGAIVTKYLSPSDNRYFILGHYERQLRFDFWDNFNTEPEHGEFVSATIDYDQWIHIVIIKQNNTLRLFLNGNQTDEIIPTIEMRDLSTTANTMIGAVHKSNELYDRNFLGTIDEVRFYEKALSQQEIDALGEL